MSACLDAAMYKSDRDNDKKRDVFIELSKIDASFINSRLSRV